MSKQGHIKILENAHIHTIHAARIFIRNNSPEEGLCHLRACTWDTSGISFPPRVRAWSRLLLSLCSHLFITSNKSKISLKNSWLLYRKLTENFDPYLEKATFVEANFRLSLRNASVDEVWCVQLISSMSLISLGAKTNDASCVPAQKTVSSVMTMNPRPVFSSASINKVSLCLRMSKRNGSFTEANPSAQ